MQQNHIDCPELSGLVQAIVDYVAQRVSERLAELVVKQSSSAGDSIFDQESIPYGVSRRKYLELARKGAFPTMKEGRRVLCRRADFDAWFSAQRPVESAETAQPRTLAPAARRRPDNRSRDELLAGAKIVASG